MRFVDKDGNPRLNIVRPINADESLLVGLKAQPDDNLAVTHFRENTDSGYLKNLQKNKNADVLYDTTSSAFPTATDNQSASLRVNDHRVMDRSDNSNIARNDKNVNGGVFLHHLCNIICQ